MKRPKGRIHRKKKAVRKKVKSVTGGARRMVSTPGAGAQLTAAISEANKSALLAAVKHAHEMWRLQAHFQDMTIMTITAIGAPGCLDGPDLDSLIRTAPTVLSQQGVQRDLRDAVADGISECFGEWQDGVTVPGLPWYPTFAAWPGPQAPPTPNVPTPLIACPSTGTGRITSSGALKGEILEALPESIHENQVEPFVASLANTLSLYFLTWIAMQQIANVLGYGPVPTFAPPYVPTGPVVAGSVQPTPGHLMMGALPPMIPMPTV